MLDMLLPYVPYVLGFLGKAVLDRLGVKIPMLPGPDSPPANIGGVDMEASQFHTWLVKVKVGTVKLDPADAEMLKLIKSAISDVEPK